MEFSLGNSGHLESMVKQEERQIDELMQANRKGKKSKLPTHI